MRPGIPNRNLILSGIAVFAMCLVVIRAFLQSATIDECDSFLGFAFGPDPMHWYPSSGNHVLNTMIMRLATQIFGIHHITLRSGAVIGAALYIFASYKLASWLEDSAIAIPLLACLLLNPFILDYLIAARGYSLALGLLMAAVAVTIRYIRTSEAAIPSAILLSLFLGLSFVANFAFAIVDFIAMLLFFGLILTSSKEPWRRAAAAVFLPAALTAMLLAGSTILSFPRNQLNFGAPTFKDMWVSMVALTEFTPNGEIINPLLRPLFHDLNIILPYVFYFSGIALILGVISRRPFRPGAYLLLLVSISLLLHLLARWIFLMMLPRDRTGIFFVALSTLLIGYLIQAQRGRAWPGIARVLGIGTLCLGAIYFVGCLRLTYFGEWQWNADTKEAHEALERAAQRYGTSNVYAGWESVAAMRFYDEAGGTHYNYLTIKDDRPPGNVLYVVHPVLDAELLERDKPEILYRGQTSEVIVGVRIAGK